MHERKPGDATEPSGRDGAPDINSLSPAQKRELLARMLAKRGQRPAGPQLVRRPELQEAPLSFSQERTYFLEQLRPGGPDHNIAGAVRLKGKLDLPALSAAVDEIARRHEILRARFQDRGGRVVQTVGPAESVRLTVIDRRDDPRAAASLEAFQLEETARPFDLERGPPCRFVLVRLGDTDAALVLTFHTLVADGWSLSVFFSELTAAYAAHHAGKPSALPPLPVQYADVAVWQRELWTPAAVEEALGFWRKALQSPPPPLQLSADRPRKGEETFERELVFFELPASLHAKLRSLGQQEGSTPFMVYLAATLAFLHRATGQTDLLVGTPVAGRSHPAMEPVIGAFNNTVVLREQVEGTLPFRELLRKVRATSLSTLAHQELPFEKIVEALQPDRGADEMPLVQVMFGYQADNRGGLTLPELEAQTAPLDHGTTRFEWSVLFLEDARAGTLTAAVAYRKDLFQPAAVARMRAQLMLLLHGIAETPDRPVSQLPFLSGEEREQLVRGWNATGAARSPDFVVDRLEGWAARTPDAVAVRSGRDVLTFGELDRRANALAATLVERGIGRERMVAVCLPRGLNAAVALLAVWKAGGAWVPIDPAYPPQRIAQLLEDSAPAVVLTEAALRDRVAGTSGAVIALDGFTATRTEAPARTLEPAQAAYVIFTSGSTGRPKGVVITQGGLAHYLHWAAATYPLPAGVPGSPVHSSLAFDLTITSLWVPLSEGREVEMVAEGPEALGEAIRRSPFSVVKITPSHLELLLQQLGTGADFHRPRTFVVGGEDLPVGLLERWFQAAPQTVVVNEYGPTETVVGCCVETLTAQDRLGDRVSIGRPIANTALYVLGPAGELQPTGAPGELYIGGDGVARGYLGRPELTAERFVPDPFSASPGARLYRTGDLVRYRSDGRLEFLGRVDSQVKLRGHRIELGEVEVALRALPGIRDAAAVVRGEGAERKLVAYLIPAAGQTLDFVRLAQELRSRLPEAMVPSAFTALDAFPLTPNGKVDRKALPEPGGTPRLTAQRFAPPEGPTQTGLAQIWCALLEIASVGIHDDFFELGGHSMLTMQLVFQIRETFGVQLPLKAVFDAPTVARLSTVIDAARDPAKASGA